MRSIQIQFEIPVNNPVSKMRIKRSKKMLTIYAPANVPDIHIMTMSDLLALAQDVEKRELSTTHNSEINPFREGITTIDVVNNKETIDSYMPSVAPSTA